MNQSLKRSLLFFITILGLVSYPFVGYAQEEEIEFESLFKDAVILSIGSPNAVYDNTDRIIDENNYNIVPYVAKQRTLVPLRFISESLGGSVAWNQASSTATIINAGKEIKITVGSNRVLVNGKKSSLDIPAQYKEGRVFVPLRFVSETIGKTVFYERGIIVISNKSILNQQTDGEIVDYLKFILSPYKKIPHTGKTLSAKEIAGFDQSVVLIEALNNREETVGFGSAFAVGHGLFLTNYHVIEGADHYGIYTDRDQYYEVAGIVAANKAADLALVKTKIRTNVPPLRIGSTQHLAKGQSVVAIGNPEGLQNTVSSGIISGLRYMEGIEMIQFTAPIAEGSSGGALFTNKGEVIGVTTASLELGNLNFAVPIHYAKSWMDNYKAMNFSKIKVLNQDQFREKESDEDEDSEVEPDVPTTPILPGNVQVLNEVVQEAVADPFQSMVYAIDESKSRIVSYKLNEQKPAMTSNKFEKPPRKLAFANGELYVIFSNAEYSPFRFEDVQGGTIMVLDPNTLRVKDQWDVDIDPYDMVVDQAGHVYVASGSGQWTYIKSYDRATKQELSSAKIHHRCKIVLHPEEDRIYAVTQDSSPRDIQVFRLNNGRFTENYDSPYHDDYKLSTAIGISPDGKYVLNGAGSVFNATSNNSSDMIYAGSITPFDMMAASKSYPQKFFTAKGNTIQQMDTNTLKSTKAYKTKGSVVKLLMTKDQLVAITKVVQPGTTITKNALEVVTTL